MEPVSRRSGFAPPRRRSRGVYWSILHPALITQEDEEQPTHPYSKMKRKVEEKIAEIRQRLSSDGGVTATSPARTQGRTRKPRPVLANAAGATAEQLREVWGPLVAEAGTYELTDNLITLRPIVAKNPAAMAASVSIVYSYRVESNTVTLTAQRDLHGPVANPFTVKLVRIE